MHSFTPRRGVFFGLYLSGVWLLVSMHALQWAYCDHQHQQVCVRMCIPNACVYTYLHACCAGGGTLIKLYPCVRVRTRKTQRPMQPLCPYIHTHVQSRRPMQWDSKNMHGIKYTCEHTHLIVMWLFCDSFACCALFILFCLSVRRVCACVCAFQ